MPLYICSLLLILLSSMPVGSTLPYVISSTSAHKVLQKTAYRLTGLKYLTYRYTRINSYPSENYNDERQGNMQMEFAPTLTAGFRYQFTTTKDFEIFNGTERFIASQSTKKISPQNKANLSQLNSASCLFNSIITLRNSLPLLIQDTAVTKHLTDTVIGTKTFYNVQFNLKQKVFDYTGGYRNLTQPGLIIINKLIIDKDSYLPVEFISRNNQNADLNHTLFGNVSEQPLALTEKSWYYSSYLDIYTPQIPKAALTLIKTGEPAPDLNLVHAQSGRQNSLGQFKDKVVLLEFWIKNCSYCISAAAELNLLHEQFKGKNFGIAAVNTHDTPQLIKLFNSAHGVK